ncbi:MAG: formimidoylglutamase [Phycisphaerales bacterium]|nr:formimidoylglutamase [Phycisphaerales bacterium]
MSSYLSVLDTTQLLPLVQKRKGEVKLGEQIQLLTPPSSWESSIQSCSAKYVLLGIPEDIGVRANAGVGGAHTAWLPFLQSFVNIQSSQEFSGAEILLLGSFDFSAWMQESQEMNTAKLRALVEKIDEEVFPVIKTIVAANKIPIVIGGGHNNAYPIIKGASLASQKSIHVINLDAHSDYRMMEGRHSGNGFRFAMLENYLANYALVGLHKNYNSESVVSEMVAHPRIQMSFYEDIFVHEKLSFDAAIQQAIKFTSSGATGIELDLDCIQTVLSSAMTPIGISALQARQYLSTCALQKDVAYLHIAEGATTLANGRQDWSTGKLIAYLVSDFIRSSLLV